MAPNIELYLIELDLLLHKLNCDVPQWAQIPMGKLHIDIHLYRLCA